MSFMGAVALFVNDVINWSQSDKQTNNTVIFVVRWMLSRRWWRTSLPL